MESIVTTVFMAWALGGLLLSFLLFRKFGNPNWSVRQRLIAGLLAYLVGIGVLYLMYSATAGIGGAT